MLEILPLPDDEDVIYTVAKWNHDFWASSGSSLEGQITAYKSLLTSTDKTFALVAYYDGILVGTICLEKQGEVYLGAGLYVLKEYRKYKIGTALVEALKSHADTLGVEKLYAWTPNLTRWYTQHGFKVIYEKVEHLGMLVDVLVTDLKGE